MATEEQMLARVDALRRVCGRGWKNPVVDGWFCDLEAYFKQAIAKRDQREALGERSENRL